MNIKNPNTINLDDLKPEQIEQLQIIIENFKQQNQKETNTQFDNLNEVEKQLQLGREFMTNYQETFNDLAK